MSDDTVAIMIYGSMIFMAVVLIGFGLHRDLSEIIRELKSRHP